jgi:hypothetical protein
MATRDRVHPQLRTRVSRLDLGSALVALAGFGLVGYGILFLIRNFTGFIDLGLTPGHVVARPIRFVRSAQTSTSTSATCK